MESVEEIIENEDIYKKMKKNKKQSQDSYSEDSIENVDIYSKMKKNKKQREDSYSEDSDYAEYESKQQNNNYKHENYHNKFSNQINVS